MNFFSQTQCRRFANGMEIYVLPRPCGTAMVQCFIRTGSIHERENLGCGLSHFLEHMLFQGCEGFPGTGAADTLQAAGCSVNAYTSYDRTVYYAKGAAGEMDLMLEVLSAMIRHARLPEQRFKAEQEVILREYDRGQDAPFRMLHEEMFRLMYLHHPLSIPIIGKREMIAHVTREMAWKYYQQRYTPGRCFWVISGAADPEKIFDKLESLLGSWQASDLFDPPPAEAAYVRPAYRESDIHFPDTVCRLGIGMKLPDAVSSNIPALDILFGVLCNGSSPRLYRKLELEQALALGINGFCYSTAGHISAGITAVSAPRNLTKLEKAIRQEIENIASNGITAAELSREKKQQYAESLRQQEDPDNVCSSIGSAVMEYGNPAYADTYLKKLLAADSDDIRKAAESLLNKDIFCTVRQTPIGSASTGKKVSSATTAGCQIFNDKQIPLVHIPMHQIPLVHMNLTLPMGALFEAPGKSGTAKILASMLGTATRDHKELQILDLLDKAGAAFSVSSGMNSFAINMNAPRRSFAKAMNIVTEILSRPIFEKSVFERELFRMQEYLKSRSTAALESAFDQVQKQLLGNHPYANGGSGSLETLNNITREEIENFYFNNFLTQRAACGFAGDCNEQDILQWSGELLSALPWQQRDAAFPDEPEFPQDSIRKLIPLEREQTAVAVGIPGACFKDLQFHRNFQLLLSAENGLASNIFKRVREDNALAYSVGMDMVGGYHPGWFIFYALTRHDKAEETEELLKAEIRRIAEEGLAADEFERAKARTIFRELQESDSTGAKLSGEVLDVYYQRKVLLTTEQKVDQLRDLSRSEVNAVLKNTFSRKPFVSVIAGKC